MSPQDIMDCLEGESLVSGEVFATYEGHSDPYFWETLLEVILPNKKFDFKTYGNRAETFGKPALEKYKTYVCKSFIICKDSDFDWLLQKENTPTPYIYETYAYSWENYACVPDFIQKYLENLHKEKFSDSLAENFKLFIKKYEALVYPVLAYLLFFNCNVDVFVMSKENIAKILKFEKAGLGDFIALNNNADKKNIKTFDAYLNVFCLHIQQKIRDLEQLFLSENAQYTQDFILKFLTNCGISASHVIFHLQGKSLYNWWLDKILELLNAQFIEDLVNQVQPKQNLESNRSKKRNVLAGNQLIKQNITRHGFDLQNPYLQKIIADIQRDFPV